MKRVKSLIVSSGLLGLVAAAGLAVAAPALKDRPAPNPLLGRWEATDLYIGGESSPQSAGLEYEFCPDGRWVIYRNGVEMTGGPRSFAAGPKAKLPAIDLTEGKEQYPGVYLVGPDTNVLTVSFSIGKERSRPAGIKPVGGNMTITFKRVNAK